MYETDELGGGVDQNNGKNKIVVQENDDVEEVQTIKGKKKGLVEENVNVGEDIDNEIVVCDEDNYENFSDFNSSDEDGSKRPKYK